MNAVTVPGSPRLMYEQLRGDGHDHGEAAARVGHAYGRKPSELSWLDAARQEWEQAQDALLVTTPADVDQLEPDSFDVAEDEITTRVAALTDERAGLSLDALSDPAKANALSDVEARLAGARVELDRLGEARREADRRALAERDAAAQRERDDALRQAGELQAKRQAAAERVDQAARAFADALAAHQTIAAQQSQALALVGRFDLGRVLAPDWALSGCMARALLDAEAPAGWCDLGLVRDPRPLSETDRKPVPSMTNSTSKKGK